MSDSPHKRTVLVGMFILVGLLALLAGIMIIGNLHQTFSKKVRVTAFFSDVNGLLPGSNVWFSGVKIGTVKKLRFHGKSEVEVLMNINEEAQQYIRKDAKAKISTDGLIGNKIVVIYDGSTKVAEVTEGDTLHVEPYLTSDEIMGTLQQNNKNILEITNNFKDISKKLNSGQGTVGKLITDESVYKDINATTNSLRKASDRAQQLMASLSTFSSKLNKEGTLMNDLVTDTVLFKSMSASVLELEKIADSASVMVSTLKRASNDPNSTLGVLLHDDESGKNIKGTIKNLESSSKKLDENLDALKYSFFLRKAFKRKAKAEK
ncbi:MAG TPA: MlaD family protein [Cytophagales bacterium]|nr:MlaD family protein [Cytophagales bacterium]